jgi:hypothetical protein
VRGNTAPDPANGLLKRASGGGILMDEIYQILRSEMWCRIVTDK